MTRRQIEDALRLSNPATYIDGVRHEPGSPEYDEHLERWADAMEASQANHASEAIEAAYQQTIAVGHLVSPEGYRIACDEKDVNRYANYLTELREREALPADDPLHVNSDSDIPFYSVDGIQREAKLPRVRQIFLGAGATWKTAFFTRAQALAALQNP